jgi:hypothetical protein
MQPDNTLPKKRSLKDFKAFAKEWDESHPIADFDALAELLIYILNMDYSEKVANKEGRKRKKYLVVDKSFYGTKENV